MVGVVGVVVVIMMVVVVMMVVWSGARGRRAAFRGALLALLAQQTSPDAPVEVVWTFSLYKKKDYNIFTEVAWALTR